MRNQAEAEGAAAGSKEGSQMRRRTFDALASAAGLVLAAVLLVAGGLLLWGHSFVDNQVSTQLSAQKIVFPTTSNPEFKALPADDFIGFHLSKMGGTYAELSGKALAQPSNAALQAQVNTVFKGTTLRGMLLDAYAFWQMGEIAFWGAIVSFIGAGILLVLSALGLYHARRVSPTAEVLTPPTPAHAA